MISIRKATEKDCSTIAKIRIDNWRTTYKGLLPQSFLDELDYEKETNAWLNFPKNDVSNVFVATNENNDILGFVGIKPFDNEATIGEIYALHTAQQFRGKGAGKALIHHSVQFFKTLQMNEMRLWVVVGNDTAIDIYQHLGAKTYTERIEVINNTDVPEIGMKWDNLWKI